MKTIRFNKDFEKLKNDEFMTIRDHDKHVFKNEIVCIKSPNNHVVVEMSFFDKNRKLKTDAWYRKEMEEYEAWIKENKENFDNVGL